MPTACCTSGGHSAIDQAFRDPGMSQIWCCGNPDSSKSKSPPAIVSLARQHSGVTERYRACSHYGALRHLSLRTTFNGHGRSVRETVQATHDATLRDGNSKLCRAKAAGARKRSGRFEANELEGCGSVRSCGASGRETLDTGNPNEGPRYPKSELTGCQASNANTR